MSFEGSDWPGEAISKKNPGCSRCQHYMDKIYYPIGDDEDACGAEENNKEEEHYWGTAWVRIKKPSDLNTDRTCPWFKDKSKPTTVNVTSLYVPCIYTDKLSGWAKFKGWLRWLVGIG